MVMLAASIPFAVAQQDCLDGIINGKFGVNATITLCPKFASQVPGLQRQLTEIAKAQGEEKEQMRELKRFFNGLNSVSQNIGQQRQIELLKNLSAQIGQQQAAGLQQTQERIADLADQLDDLKNLLIEKLGNTSTRDRTTTAVDGPVGDAIAKFDLAKAHDLLEDIRAQLNVIGNEVSKVHADTSEIKQTIEQEAADAAQRRKEEEERQKAAEEQAKKAQERQVFQGRGNETKSARPRSACSQTHVCPRPERGSAQLSPQPDFPRSPQPLGAQSEATALPAPVSNPRYMRVAKNHRALQADAPAPTATGYRLVSTVWRPSSDLPISSR